MSETLDELLERVSALTSDLAALQESVGALRDWAPVDPGMAASVLRHLLDQIIRHVHVRRFNAHPGNQPLATLLRKLRSENVLPERVDAAADAIATTGTIAVHSHVAHTLVDLERDLEGFLLVLEWYVAEFRHESASALPGREPPDPLMFDRLPLPLARRILRTLYTDPKTRHDLAYGLWEWALALLGSTAVAAYAADAPRDARLDDLWPRLDAPTPADWWEVVRRLAPELGGRGDIAFGTLRGLLLARPRPDLPKLGELNATLTEVLDQERGARGSVALPAVFERVVRYRDLLVGENEPGRRADAYYERVGDLLLAGFEELVGPGGVDVLAGRRLLYVDEVRRLEDGAWRVERVELRGREPIRIEPLSIPPESGIDPPATKCILLERGFARLAFESPHPLLVFDEATEQVRRLSASSEAEGRVSAVFVDESDVCRPVPAEIVADLQALRAILPHRPAAETSIPATRPPEPPKTLPNAIQNCEVTDTLAEGRSGMVYLGRDHLGRPVVIHLVPGRDGTEALDRFLESLVPWASVMHPSLAAILGRGRHDRERFFYSQELIEGASLAEVLGRLRRDGGGRIPSAEDWRGAVRTVISRKRDSLDGWPRRADPENRENLPNSGSSHEAIVVEVARRVAEGLAELHQAGLVHGDLQPSKIMVTDDDRRPAVLLPPITLALEDRDEDDAGATFHPLSLGVMLYSSPEQVQPRESPLDGRSDLYSLGAILWELLTLQPLYGIPRPRGINASNILYAIATNTPDPVRRHNPAVPPALEAIVARCLEKDPARRFASASALAEALGALGDLAVAGPPEPPGTIAVRAGIPSPSPRARSRRSALLAALAIVALVALIAWGILFGRRPVGHGPPPIAPSSDHPSLPVPRPLEPFTTPWELLGGLLGSAAILAGLAGAVHLIRKRAGGRRPAHPVPTPESSPSPAASGLATRSKVQPVVRIRDTDAFSSQTVLLHYPAPIAFAYRRFCQQSGHEARVDRLFRTVEATIKYLVVLGASDLFQCLASSGASGLPERKEFAFLHGPRPMSLGLWLDALREIARALADQPGRFVAELPAVCRPDGPLLGELLGPLIALRNKRKEHRPGSLPITPAQARELVREARPLLEKVFQEIRFVRRYPLGFATRGFHVGVDGRTRYRIHSCMGARINPTQDANVVEVAFRIAEHVPFVAAPDDSAVLYLWPFLLERVAEHSQRHTLYLFEGIPDARGSCLSRTSTCAIDLEDPWEPSGEELEAILGSALGPGLARVGSGAVDHGWLFERLRALPAVLRTPPELAIARGLGEAQVGALTGESVGPYTLLAPIARGGFGVVYDAERREDGRRVAVKVLEWGDSGRQYERFVQEFDKLRAAASHPGIIECFENGVAVVAKREYPWYAMEFAAGGDLGSRIDDRNARARGAPPWLDPELRREAAGEFRALVDAVAHLHGLRIVHRDLKPENVLILESGSLRLSDFGLAKDLAPADRSRPRTSSGAVLGTRCYMAPEQLAGGDVSLETDVYALGVVLYQLATGLRPPEARLGAGDGDGEEKGSTLAGRPELRPLPEPLRRLILACTQSARARRPKHAGAVAEAFATVAGEG